MPNRLAVVVHESARDQQITRINEQMDALQEEVDRMTRRRNEIDAREETLAYELHRLEIGDPLPGIVVAMSQSRDGT